MIKAIIFDVDGVIIESADIKTLAFEKLFKQYCSSPEEIKAIIDYHLSNMGISRYVKFRYFFENILGKTLSKKKEEELGERFSNIVLDEVLKASLVPGVLDFLNNNFSRYPIFIASGTPQDELTYIISQRGLSGYFKGIHGSPQSKASIIAGILTRNSLRADEAVFIGDAESDLKAARAIGVHFVARISSASVNLSGCRHKIDNLEGLESLIALL